MIKSKLVSSRIETLRNNFELEINCLKSRVKSLERELAMCKSDTPIFRVVGDYLDRPQSKVLAQIFKRLGLRLVKDGELVEDKNDK